MTAATERKNLEEVVRKLYPTVNEYFVKVLLDVYEQDPAWLNHKLKEDTKKDKQQPNKKPTDPTPQLRLPQSIEIKGITKLSPGDEGYDAVIPPPEGIPFTGEDSNVVAVLRQGPGPTVDDVTKEAMQHATVVGQPSISWEELLAADAHEAPDTNDTMT